MSQVGRNWDRAKNINAFKSKIYDFGERFVKILFGYFNAMFSPVVMPINKGVEYDFCGVVVGEKRL